MSGEWDRRNKKRVAENLAAWRKRNPEKLKVQAKNAAPYKKKWHFKRMYGLSPVDYQRLLLRQRERCLGCNEMLIPGRKTHTDHNHKTGQVRGLLCHRCNAGLGFLKESPATMYQLAAYLELDRTRPVVYLIGSLRNKEVVTFGNELRSRGFECVDNWHAAGPTADDSWRDYSIARGRTYQQALESREARHVFHFDKAYIHLADAVVLLYPAGKSGHLEFGYAVGQGRKGYILMEETPERYDVMLQFAHAPLFHEKEVLLERMQSDLMNGKVTG